MSERVDVILLFSGGYDSTCLLKDLVNNPAKYTQGINDEADTLVIHPVYCSYGNKNTEKEQKAAKAIIKLLTEEDDDTREVTSCLNSLTIVPMPLLSGEITDNGGDCSQGEFAKQYVPYRNATMVLTALSALTTEKLYFDAVFLGTHKTDTELRFPDCGKDFRKAINLLLEVYCVKGISPTVDLPFELLTKSEITRLYGLPKQLHDAVFSGYTDGRPPAVAQKPHKPIVNTDVAEDEEDPRPPRGMREPLPPEVSATLARDHSQPCPVLTGKEVVQVKPLTQDEATALATAGNIMEKTFQEQPSTSLMVKEYEPLIIRKFTQYGFPIYVGLICGANLDNLDRVVHGFLKGQKARIQGASIQTMRNIVGELSGHIVETYDLKIEGVAVVWYVDKMMVTSLYGDFMTHTSCRIEFYSLLQMMCHV